MRTAPRRITAIVLALSALTAATACSSSTSGTGGTGSASSSAGGESSTSFATSTDVSFVVDGTTYGTLETPLHHSGATMPAALILAGSGPTDRNGDQTGLTPDTLRLIADTLARAGVMSLRFDKYFSGKTGAGAFASDPSKATLPVFVRQADAAYDVLRGEQGVDRSKLLVVGHSEGGKYALLVDESVSVRPAGLALIEPQDERSLDLLTLQIDEQLDAAAQDGSISTQTAQTNKTGVRQAIDEFRSGQPVSYTGLLPSLVSVLRSIIGANAAYTHSEDPISPVTLATKVAAGTKVLVTDGSRDTNVPPSTIGPLVHALTAAGTTGPGLVLLHDVDHELHLSDQPATDQVIAPAAATAITRWAALFTS